MRATTQSIANCSEFPLCREALNVYDIQASGCHISVVNTRVKSYFTFAKALLWPFCKEYFLDVIWTLGESIKGAPLLRNFAFQRELQHSMTVHFIFLK